MTNTVTNILSHDEELALRKPIEDYVGKIQAEIDELREEGTNKVLEYSEEIEVLKRDKIYTKSEKEARISELNGKLQKAKEIEAKNKQPINDKIAVAEKYLKDHYQTDYYNKVVESNKYEVQKAKADYDKKLKELEKENKGLNKIIEKFKDNLKKFLKWLCHKFSYPCEDDLIRDFNKETYSYINFEKQLDTSHFEKDDNEMDYDM